jgi:uncharacterized SAM-binding protein YcdF (DUF218 family)
MKSSSAATSGAAALGPYRLAPGPMLPAVVDPRKRRWRRRLTRIGLAIAALALVAALHRPILQGYAGLFRVDDPAPSDAIVVLIGGADHRAPHAAKLYRQGLAPVVLIGTSTTDRTSVFNETEVAVAEMVRLGVPRSAIMVMPGQVTSTRHEVDKVVEYARSHPLRRITVVTTAFHTARARWIFRKTMQGQGIEVRMAAARHRDFDETDWFRSDEGLVTYFTETFKTIYYRLKY